jgi:hypothetical protein
MMVRRDLSSMKRSGLIAIAAVCVMPIVAAIGAWRSGVGVEAGVTAVVMVVGAIFGYAIIAVPDRKRAALAAPTDSYRGSAQLHVRGLRKTAAFKEKLKKARTLLLVLGQVSGDLSIGDDGIVWRPGRNGIRKKFPELHMEWAQVKSLRIMVAPGTRDPAWLLVELADGTPVQFTINRYKDLRKGLVKNNYVKWDVIEA